MRTWLVALCLVAACDEPEVPVGPPRCEPEREHELDRRLKLGFKALVMGEPERARSEFQAVLAEEPQHPEAHLGLRLLQGTAPLQPQDPPPAPDTEEGLGKHVEVAGSWLPVGMAVEAERWRFEELRALAPLRRARDGVGAQFTFYRARAPSGTAIASTDRDSLRKAIDLIVLHDSHTRTAREAIVELEGRGGSTHFIIDWDGTIHQVLDLVWEANHTQLAAIDARSVSIDLVNPVDLGDKPGLPDEAEARGEHRPLSDFVRVQRDEVQQWGYTEAQLTSLGLLVRALGVLFPELPLRVPEQDSGIPRRTFDAPQDLRGVIGHLHVSRRAQDPGAGFPWEAFDRVIRGP